MAELGFEKRDFRKVPNNHFQFLTNSAEFCLEIIHMILLSVCVCKMISFVYMQVVYCMDRALALALACQRFKILKAECLALLGRYPEAQSVARYGQEMHYHGVQKCN